MQKSIKNNKEQHRHTNFWFFQYHCEENTVTRWHKVLKMVANVAHVFRKDLVAKHVG